MKTAYNERLKLLAGNLDRLSTAFAVIGVVTPVVAWSYDIPTAPSWTISSFALSGVWLSAAVGLQNRPGYRIQDDSVGSCAASAFSESRQPPFWPML